MSIYRTAPWELLVTIMTVAVSAFELVVSGAFLVTAALMPAGQTGTAAVMGTAAVVSLGLLAVMAALGPTGYRLDERGVTVIRRGPNVVIPAAEIASIEEMDEGAFTGAVRLAASGGVFGYWGLWKSRQWGRFQAYATRRQGVVVIRRHEGRPVLLTPDRPAEFVAEARRRSGVGGGA